MTPPGKIESAIRNARRAGETGGAALGVRDRSFIVKFSRLVDLLD